MADTHADGGKRTLRSMFEEPVFSKNYNIVSTGTIGSMEFLRQKSNVSVVTSDDDDDDDSIGSESSISSAEDNTGGSSSRAATAKFRSGRNTPGVGSMSSLKLPPQHTHNSSFHVKKPADHAAVSKSSARSTPYSSQPSSGYTTVIPSARSSFSCNSRVGSIDSLDGLNILSVIKELSLLEHAQEVNLHSGSLIHHIQVDADNYGNSSMSSRPMPSSSRYNTSTRNSPSPLAPRTAAQVLASPSGRGSPSPSKKLHGGADLRLGGGMGFAGAAAAVRFSLAHSHADGAKEDLGASSVTQGKPVQHQIQGIAGAARAVDCTVSVAAQVARHGGRGAPQRIRMPANRTAVRLEQSGVERVDVDSLQELLDTMCMRGTAPHHGKQTVASLLSAANLRDQHSSSSLTQMHAPAPVRPQAHSGQAKGFAGAARAVRLTNTIAAQSGRRVTRGKAEKY
jgi:hypothetical protein